MMVHTVWIVKPVKFPTSAAMDPLYFLQILTVNGGVRRFSSELAGVRSCFG